MNVCPGRAWLTIAITMKLIVSIHPLHCCIHPYHHKLLQLYTRMLQPAVAGYIRYMGVSLGAVRTLVWCSFLVSDIFSSRTF